MKHILSVFFCLLFTLSPFAQSLKVDTLLTIKTTSSLDPQLDFISNQGTWSFSGPQKLNNNSFLIDWKNNNDKEFTRLSIESSTGDVGFKTDNPQASVDIRHRLVSGVAIRTDGMGGDPGEGLFLNGGGRNKLKNWASISAGYYSNYDKTIARSSEASGINFVNGNIIFKTIYGANIGANNGIPAAMKIDSVGDIYMMKKLDIKNNLVAHKSLEAKHNLIVTDTTYLQGSVLIGRNRKKAKALTQLDLRVGANDGLSIRPWTLSDTVPVGAGLYLTSGGRDYEKNFAAMSSGMKHNMYRYEAVTPEAASIEFRNGNIHFKTQEGLTVGKNYANEFPTRLLIGADGAISIPGNITSTELKVDATATVNQLFVNKANVLEEASINVMNSNNISVTQKASINAISGNVLAIAGQADINVVSANQLMVSDKISSNMLNANQLEVTGQSVFAAGLYSRGTIKATEVIIEIPNDTWPDFVFSDNYKLLDLSEVEAHIIKNGHLPEVPSASQVAEDGVSVGEMNRVLLQKVEELTLYMIEQQKRIEELENIVKQ